VWLRRYGVAVNSAGDVYVGDSQKFAGNPGWALRLRWHGCRLDKRTNTFGGFHLAVAGETESGPLRLEAGW